ncbi:hypothetical protein BGZ83_007003 [Gryganskiella cystojenkinii]|nr:hypothetical protein BGZ83_007003 [Gryganskiella cystojenkinii]
MPKRGNRGGGGGHRGGRGGSRGGRGRGGGGGGGRGGGSGGQFKSKSHGGYTNDYNGDGFADDDDFISFSGRNQRRQKSTEEDIYRKIQAAKGQRGGGRGGGNPGGYRPPPPPPKQNSNGKNSKHFFWPHPDHHNQASSSSSASFNNNSNNGQRGNVRRDPVQVMFNRASHLTDPTMLMQHRQEDDNEFDDEDDDEEDEDQEDYESEIDSDEDSDDMIDRDIDSDDESGDEILMQQFNWIEEETDQNRPKAPVVADRASNSGVGASSAAILEPLSSMSTLESAMTQSEDFMEALDMQDKYDVDNADETRRPSRPISALSTTSLKSNGHLNKKSKTSTADQTVEIMTMVLPLSAAGHASEEVTLSSAPVAADGWFIDTTTNADIPMAVPVAKERLKEKEGATTAEEGSSLWFMDTTPDMNTVAAIQESKETYITLPIEEAYSQNPKKKAHRSKRGGRKQKEKQAAAAANTHKDLVVGHDDDGLIYLEEPSEDEDDEMMALDDYLQNTMDPDNPDGLSSLLGALKGLHSGGMGHSNNIGGENADSSDYEQDGSEDDSDDFDFEEDYTDGYKKKLDFTRVGMKDKRKNRKADDLLREELEDLMPLWRSGALEDGDVQPIGGKNKARRAKSYDTYVLDESDEDFLNGVAGRAGTKKNKKNKKEPHGGSFESLMEINRSIEEFVRDKTSDSLQLPPMPKPLRRKVHLLCNHYNLRSQSVGSGKRRFPILIKTNHTRMPVNPVSVTRLLQQSENEIKSTLQGILKSQGRGNKNSPGGSGNGGSSTPKFNKSKARGGGSMAAPHGTVVGAEASEISHENLGHRMLSKMGWSPGVGLGASGEGITQPIEAVMRAKRRGLGHGE